MTTYISVLLENTSTSIDFFRDITIYAGVMLALFFVLKLHNKIIENYRQKIEKMEKRAGFFVFSGAVVTFVVWILSCLILDKLFVIDESITTMQMLNFRVTTARCAEVFLATAVAMAWLFSVAANKVYCQNRQMQKRKF